MKVELVWPLPVQHRLQIDKPITIERLPVAATRRSVRRVEIEYYGTTLVDELWFMSLSSTIWHFKVRSTLMDGRVLVYQGSSQLDIELALDYIYAQAVQHCFDLLCTEAQQQLVSVTA